MTSPTFARDHDLVGRYRIGELLGAGATTEVYLSQDLTLHRTVVVKVLLANLAAHEDVRRAFRDNIVRAATLSHPHVARVYDGGQEAGSIFVITEYLNGGSLEDVLASGRHLNTDDAARLGRDVASGLAYLHANGVVHGALSPSKLLFDNEGRVRISDISTAGLASSYREQLTFAQVRYLSPEQALGQPAGPMSDVYTLALILFEAATGTSPFDSMTVEGMLRGRVNTPLPVRPELGTLDMLLAQAAVPDPLLRLDAEQFASRLNAVVNDSAPLIVPRVADGLPLLAQFTPPEPRTSIGFRPPSADQVAGSGPRVTRGRHEAVEPEPTFGMHRPLTAREAIPRSARSSSPRHFEPPISPPPPRRRLAFLLAAVLLVLVAAGGGVAWKMGLFSSEKAVPSLESLSYKQASQLLQGYGFTLTVTQQSHSSSVPANEIISQSPAAGSKGKAGLVVDVVVSDGPLMVALPANLVGEDCATATAQLQSLHLSALCPASIARPNTTVAAGDIIRVIYHHKANPKAVPLHSQLTLVLSTGSPGTSSSTTTTLRASTSSTTPTTTAPSTTTTTQPTPTTSTTLAGQGLRPVPNVIGMNYSETVAAFTRAQLYFTTRGHLAGTTKWTKVISTVPAPGTMVAYRSTIILNVQ